MSKSCMTCRFFKSSGCRGVCTFLCCTTTAGEWCRKHKDRILFDKITTSLRVLAKKLVYFDSSVCDDDGIGYPWCSTLIDDGGHFETEAKAVTATLAILNAPVESEVKDEA